MKTILVLTMICLSMYTFGQEGITFEVEELSKPKELLYVEAYDDIYKHLILKDVDLDKLIIDHDDSIDYNILAKSKAPDSLVNYRYNSFFNGMYAAYANHRPFVLSPDMVWLLINQGFARHVNANPEKLRDYFVSFSGTQTLVVHSKKGITDDTLKWEEVFPQFTSQIENHVGKELIATLTSDFSTTTPVEQVASEITIMKAMEAYFEFVVMRTVCGIPEITLQGTTEDWQKVYDKTKKIAKYDLQWWTDELEPILKEFINASKGDIDKKFWRNMFKYHSKKKYGAPKTIDGWIVKFFPYDKYGRRNTLDKLIGTDSLPEEIVKVDVKYIETDGTHTKETMLELWSGFIGLEQDPKTFALTPKISWMIRKKEGNQSNVDKVLEKNNIPSVNRHYGINLNVIDVPEALKKLGDIYTLNLHFKEKVFIPKWMKNIRIGQFFIEGKISKKEKQKLLDWFPNTEITINEKLYNEGKNGWFFVADNEISEELLKLNKIWVLMVYPHDPFEGLNMTSLEALKNIEIEIFMLTRKTTEENIKKIKQWFPNTKIFIKDKRIQ